MGSVGNRLGSRRPNFSSVCLAENPFECCLCFAFLFFGGKQAELEFQLCSSNNENNNNNIITKITAMHMKYKYSDAAVVVDAGVAKSARNKHEFFFIFVQEDLLLWRRNC